MGWTKGQLSKFPSWRPIASDYTTEHFNRISRVVDDCLHGDAYAQTHSSRELSWPIIPRTVFTDFTPSLSMTHGSPSTSRLLRSSTTLSPTTSGLKPLGASFLAISPSSNVDHGIPRYPLSPADNSFPDQSEMDDEADTSDHNQNVENVSSSASVGYLEALN